WGSAPGAGTQGGVQRGPAGARRCAPPALRPRAGGGLGGGGGLVGEQLAEPARSAGKALDLQVLDGGRRWVFAFSARSAPQAGPAASSRHPAWRARCRPSASLRAIHVAPALVTVPPAR